MVVELEQPRDRSVEAQHRHVVADRHDRAMEEPAARLVVGRSVRDAQLSGRLVDDVAPQALQEAVHADDVGGGPRTLLVERTHEHLVETQRVGAVFAIDVVGRDRVLQALAHLPELALDRSASRKNPPSRSTTSVASTYMPRSSMNAGARM